MKLLFFFYFTLIETESNLFLQQSRKLSRKVQQQRILSIGTRSRNMRTTQVYRPLSSEYIFSLSKPFEKGNKNHSLPLIFHSQNIAFFYLFLDFSMLTRSSRSLYLSLHTLSSRLSSSYAKTSSPSSKLTQSYYNHVCDIPLLHHTVGQHLNQLAEAHPNHECYAFKAEGNKRYTYKSFLDEVDSLALSLIELGFQKGDRIGVWLPNTSENCAMTYAASKAGLIKV